MIIFFTRNCRKVCLSLGHIVAFVVMPQKPVNFLKRT